MVLDVCLTTGRSYCNCRGRGFFLACTEDREPSYRKTACRHSLLMVCQCENTVAGPGRRFNARSLDA
jgi:hypothetical protein